MSLAALDVADFRCIEQARLEFDPRLTLISGENASGKTSLLEAIFFLSCGRSFRSPHLDALIRTGQPAFTAVGQMDRGPSGTLTLGVKASRHGSELRIGGQPASGFAQMAGALPVQVIDPEVHRLLEEGPAYRRRFLDWGVFHVEPSFVAAWRRYQRALKQRNAALRAKSPSPLVHVWDADLVDAGQFIAEQRERYVASLLPWVAKFGRELLDVEISLVLQPGWPMEKTLLQALEGGWLRDQTRGTTTNGPHRADLIVSVDALPARDRVSRGQQKLLAAALLLAQIQLRSTSEGSATSLLLDDPAAELDVVNLQRLLGLVTRVPAQLIVTALDPTRLELPKSGRSFHVKQGKVEPMIYSRPPSAGLSQ